MTTASPGPAPADFPQGCLRQRNPDDVNDYEDTVPHNVQHGRLNNELQATQEHVQLMAWRLSILDARVRGFVPIYF